MYCAKATKHVDNQWCKKIVCNACSPENVRIFMSYKQAATFLLRLTIPFEKNLKKAHPLRLFQSRLNNNRQTFLLR